MIENCSTTRSRASFASATRPSGRRSDQIKLKAALFSTSIGFEARIVVRKGRCERLRHSARQAGAFSDQRDWEAKMLICPG
jgi:hypothetical protein